MSFDWFDDEFEWLSDAGAPRMTVGNLGVF